MPKYLGSSKFGQSLPDHVTLVYVAHTGSSSGQIENDRVYRVWRSDWQADQFELLSGSELRLLARAAITSGIRIDHDHAMD